MPHIIPDYNKHMGGVNLFDQMTRFYAVLSWPIAFMYNFLELETAAMNSLILYRAIHQKFDRKDKAALCSTWL